MKNKDKQKNQSHLKNLVHMATMDNKIDDAERQFLFRLAQKLNIPHAEFQSIVSDPSNIEFQPPLLIEEKVGQLKDLVMMMMIDGNIDHREIEFCKKISIRMGVNPKVIPDIIDALMKDSMARTAEISSGASGTGNSGKYSAKRKTPLLKYTLFIVAGLVLVGLLGKFFI